MFGSVDNIRAIRLKPTNRSIQDVVKAAPKQDVVKAIPTRTKIPKSRPIPIPERRTPVLPSVYYDHLVRNGCGTLLRLVPEKDRTPSLCVAAVRNTWKALPYVPPSLVTVDMLMTALLNTKDVVCCISYFPPFMSIKLYAIVCQAYFEARQNHQTLFEPTNLEFITTKLQPVIKKLLYAT